MENFPSVDRIGWTYRKVIIFRTVSPFGGFREDFPQGHLPLLAPGPP